MSIKLENMRRRQAIIDLYLNDEVTKEFMIETITSLNELEDIELQKENSEPVKNEPETNQISDILTKLESKQVSESDGISGSVVEPDLGSATPAVPAPVTTEPPAPPAAEPPRVNSSSDETIEPLETYQVLGTGDSELNAQILSSIDPNVAEAEALTHLTPKELKITKRKAVSSEKKAKFKYTGKKVLLKSLYSLIPLLTILSSGYFAYVLSNFSSNNGLGVDLAFIPVMIAGAVSALYITSMSAIKKKEYDNPKYKWNFLKKLQDALNAEGPKVIYEARKKYRETVDAEDTRRGKTR